MNGAPRQLPNIVKRASEVAFGQVVGVLLFAVFTVISARSMSVSEFGLFTATYAATLILADVTDFGTGASLILSSSNMGVSKLHGELGVLRSSRTLSLSALGIVGSAVLYLTSPALLPLFAVVIALTWLFSMRVVRQVQQRCQGLYIQSSLTLIVERSATVIASLLVVPSSPVRGLACIAIGTAVAVLFSGREWHFSKSLRDIAETHKRARPLGVSSVASDVTTMDVPVLSLVVNSVAAGLYAVPSRLLAPLSFVGSAFSTVLLRELPFLPPEEVRRSTQRWVLIVCSVALGVCVPLAICASWVVPTLLGPQYADAITPVRLACATAVAQCGSTVASAGLQALLKSRTVARIYVLSAIAGLTGVTLGGLAFGAVGACAAMLAVQAVQFLTILRALRRPTLVEGK